MLGILYVVYFVKMSKTGCLWQIVSFLSYILQFPITRPVFGIYYILNYT